MKRKPNKASSNGGGIDLPGRIDAVEYHFGGEGISKQPTDDDGGGENIGWIDHGDRVGYHVTIEPGVYTLRMRLASPNTGRSIHVRLNETDLTTMPVPETGDWQAWETVAIEDLLIDPGGQATLVLDFLGDGMNVNWVEFERTGDPPADGGVSPARVAEIEGSLDRVMATLEALNDRFDEHEHTYGGPVSGQRTKTPGDVDSGSDDDDNGNGNGDEAGNRNPTKKP